MKLLNAKLVMTVLIGIAYFGPLIWALTNGKLDVGSYVAGVGPLFGMAWAFWFKDQETKPQ